MRVKLAALQFPVDEFKMLMLLVPLLYICVMLCYANCTNYGKENKVVFL